MTLRIESERLVMRGWREADLDALAEIGADPAATRHLGAMSREESWRRMAYFTGHFALRGFGFLALEEKATGACIGWCGHYFPDNWPDREIGYTLVRSARGKGYATEAARRALVHAYDELGWTTAISFIALSNSASIAVATRLGATLESTRIYRDFECGIFRQRSPADFSATQRIH